MWSLLPRRLQLFCVVVPTIVIVWAAETVVSMAGGADPVAAFGVPIPNTGPPNPGAGTHPTSLTIETLMRQFDLPIIWQEQEALVASLA